MATVITAMSEIEGIKITVSAEISPAAVQCRLSGGESFDADEARQRLCAALAPALAAALVQAEQEVLSSLVASIRPQRLLVKNYNTGF